jgi:predicted nucleic acid-binding protein
MRLLLLLIILSQYWPVLLAMLQSGRVSGPHVHDARIEALCRKHSVRELWTADRDFGRFPGMGERELSTTLATTP